MPNFFDDQWFHCFQNAKCTASPRRLLTVQSAGTVGNNGFHTIQFDDGGSGLGCSTIDPGNDQNNRIFFFEINPNGETVLYAATSVTPDGNGHIMGGKFMKLSTTGERLLNGSDDWTSNRPTV